MDKFPLLSKTNLGALATLAPIILPMFGVNFSANDADLISHNVDQIIQAGGALLAIYGRFSVGKKVVALKNLVPTK